jgi:hypothetical protein
VTGNVGGNVSGSVASVTAGVTVSDKTGFSLSSAGVQAIWEYATRTLSSFGSLVSDIATAVWGAGTRTLTGFGTLIVDIWSYTTRRLTDATNITSNGSTISQTQLAYLDAAISSRLAAEGYTAPDNATIAAIAAYTGTTIPAQIAGLNNLSSAQVTTAVDAALGTAVSEPTGISDKSIKGILWHLFSRFYNKNTQTASAQTTYKANGTTVLATRTASDDGTTQTLGAAE